MDSSDRFLGRSRRKLLPHPLRRDDLSRISVTAAERNMQRASYCTFGPAGVRALMLSPIAPPEPPRCVRIRVTRELRGSNQRESGGAGRNEIGHIVEAGSRFTEVEIPAVGMTDHRIERVDGLVRHREWNATQSHIKQWRNDAIRSALGHGFYDSPADLLGVETLSIAADDSGQSPASESHVSVSQRGDDGSGFLLKITGGKTCRGEEQLSGIAQETGLELGAPYHRRGKPVSRADHGQRE